MAAPKGIPMNPGGRPKGIPNKDGKALREMVVGALDELGGQTWLVAQAKLDPKTFINMFSKLLPKDVATSISVSDSTGYTISVIPKSPAPE